MELLNRSAELRQAISNMEAIARTYARMIEDLQNVESEIVCIRDDMEAECDDVQRNGGDGEEAQAMLESLGESLLAVDLALGLVGNMLLSDDCYEVISHLQDATPA